MEIAHLKKTTQNFYTKFCPLSALLHTRIALLSLSVNIHNIVTDKIMLF